MFFSATDDLSAEILVRYVFTVTSYCTTAARYWRWMNAELAMI